MGSISNTKYGGLVDTIRNGILDGVYTPGQRLPTRTEMARMFDVSMVTVQTALNTLLRDGFVCARTGAGTFVSDRPPHLYNYALISQAKGKWSRWLRSVHEAANMIQADSDLQINEYLTSAEVAMRGDVTRLCKDVCSHRLSGLIFTSYAAFDEITGTPILEQKNIPHVLGTYIPDSDIPSVRMDVNGSFIRRAVEYLVSRGRRRIAHLRLVSDLSDRKMIEETLAGTGIELRPYWLQSVYGGMMHETTPNMITMMMQLQGDKRPDALIIYDDNLIEHATAGLMAAGVRMPQELDVVAHFNFPEPVINTLPMKRLGFDCRVFLHKCIEVLNMQHRGERPPDITAIPSVFEEELGIDSLAFHDVEL